MVRAVVTHPAQKVDAKVWSIAVHQWHCFGPEHYVERVASLGQTIGWCAEIPAICSWPELFRTKREAVRVVNQFFLDGLDARSKS